MGGKSYFCDYCDCYMKNDVNVRKTHNWGLTHTIAKTTFLKQFDDPQKVYEKELTKAPCKRYERGLCKFGLHCQQSHYSSKQLNKLRKLAFRLERKAKKQPSKRRAITYNYKNYLPWLKEVDYYTKIECLQKKLKSKVPPSLLPIKFYKNLPNLNSKLYEWG